MAFCSECGMELKGKGAFCSACGTRVSPGEPSGSIASPEPNPLSLRAKDAMDSGDHERALELLREWSTADGDDYRVHNNMALVLNKMGEHERALGSFDRALELEDSNTHIWFGRGSALFGLKRYSDARESYGKALAIDPDNLRARSGLERCDSMLEDSLLEDDGEKAGPAGDGGDGKPCPVCASLMRHWEGNWWCDTCDRYPLLDDAPTLPVPVESAPYAQDAGVPAAPDTCSGCGGPLRFVSRYGRYWCTRCERYERQKGGAVPGSAAPGGAEKCPRCGNPSRFIKEYGRKWCNTCRVYL
jgi:tetratricopeptide (TPR) repeat protein